MQFVKAMIIWANTVDGGQAVDDLRAEGRDVPADVLPHISRAGK
jgi:hypothetical protein